MSFGRVFRGDGCAFCSRKHDTAQKELYEFVKFFCPDAQYNVMGVLSNKRFELDIYIPSLKKAIELDGEYWHSLPGAQERDTRKTQECQEAGIELLRIGYTKHWYNSDTGKEMVLQFLKA